MTIEKAVRIFMEEYERAKRIHEPWLDGSDETDRIAFAAFMIQEKCRKEKDNGEKSLE